MNYCSSHLDKYQLDFDNTLSTVIFLLALVNEEVAFYEYCDVTYLMY
jgi:hypothetical protein